MTPDDTMTEIAADSSAAASDAVAADTAPQSFLIADCGHTNTTVALFDEAAGSYRLIMRATVPTTAAEPWADIHLAVRQAVQQIAAATGRTLLNPRGDLIRPGRASGTGIDAFAAVISAAPPLKTILAGLFEKVSLASARCVVRNSYACEVDTFSLADTRSENEQITSIVQHQPDLIFVAGGTDGGAEEHLLDLIETIKIGALVTGEIKPPHILFAGNKKLREQVRTILGEKIRLHVADNVRPALDAEYLDDAARLINELYESIKIKSLPGIQQLSTWNTIPFQPTAQALASIVKYFASLHKGRVMAVDLGSNQTTIVEAAPDKKRRLWIQSDLGMGQPVANLLDRVKVADVTRWLPATVSESEAHNFILNKALYPQTVPATETELYLEQAVAREILRCVTEEAKANWYGSQAKPAAPLRLLLARGSTLTAVSRPSQALLILLDMLQPTGIFAVGLDTYGILPALGALAVHEPLAAVQALEGAILANLGWVVAPAGKGQPGQKVLNIVLESGESQRLEVEVEYGTIETLPLASGQSAKVILRPTRHFDVGFGPGQEQTITIRGGLVGLVIDARGRPLDLAADDDARQTLLRQWHWDIGS